MTTTKPTITYSRTMHVYVPSKDMSDDIANELHPFYTKDDDGLHISWKNLTSYIDDEDTDVNPDAYKFILEAYNSAEGEIGDVVFWRNE